MITQATALGLRPYQEDRFFSFEFPEHIILGVFDGHGGEETAAKVAELMPKRLAYWLDNEDDLSLVLKESFAEVNTETKWMEEGSAASVVIIDKDRRQAAVAILGDSPVIIRIAGSPAVMWTAPEHNVRTNIAEAEAARARGGFTSDGYLYKSYRDGGLQMTRAFGDSFLEGVLDREPEIATMNLDDKSWVLVATDGAFDPSHNDDKAKGIVGTLINKNLLATAPDVVNRAIQMNTGDNVTALLWRAE